MIASETLDSVVQDVRNNKTVFVMLNKSHTLVECMKQIKGALFLAGITKGHYKAALSGVTLHLGGKVTVGLNPSGSIDSLYADEALQQDIDNFMTIVREKGEARKRLNEQIVESIERFIAAEGTVRQTQKEAS